MTTRALVAAILCASISLGSQWRSTFKDEKQCRYLPGDADWPNESAWTQLNSTVGGRLIATVPTASVCHGDMYDEIACAALKKIWDFPQPHLVESAGIMSPYFQNQSCDPFSPTSTPCALGNYVSYSINISGVDDVKAGIRFAKDHNVRLVVKNTGHDYLGRSTGKGGLSLWMHNLNITTVEEHYQSPHYTGPAMKIGAGVLAADAYAAAHQHGLRVVGGGCPSTGIAGGYTQGGGHSLLSSTHGLSADNVLAWEVVTAEGEHLVATPTQHKDLYWALSGGGGGTFGVVMSMTVRAFPDGPVGGAFLSFNSSSVGPDKFWEVVDLFHTILPSIVDTGATALYQITDGVFVMLSMTAPGLTQTMVTELLSPLVAGMNERQVPHVLVQSYFDNFYDHFAQSFGPLPYGPIPVSDVITSRLLPRSLLLEQPAKAGRTLRSIVEGESLYIGIMALSVNQSVSGSPANAVLPAWRSTLLQTIVGAPWNWSLPREDMLARQQHLVDNVIPALEELSPDSGTYLNEGNSAQPQWQRAFYGANYDRLLAIKQHYDPAALMYAAMAVGSEAWEADPTGRLCRTGTDWKDGRRAGNASPSFKWEL